jgi:hypothetical protein
MTTRTSDPRYVAKYKDGYWVVIDTATGEVVPAPAGHYKRHKDGYLWDYAAALEAAALNAEDSDD